MQIPYHVFRKIYFLLLSLSLPATTFASNSGADAPFQIMAHSVEANEKTGVAVYSGAVRAEQGGLRITADRLEIRTRRSKTDLVIATGKPVRLRQRPEFDSEDILAQANRITYDVNRRKIEMVGQAALRRGSDVYTGHMLHYDLNEQNLVAQGDEITDGLVHAVIHPRKKTFDPTPVPSE